MERRVKTSLVWAAGLANWGDYKELALETPLASSCWHPCAFWSRQEAGKTSKYTHVLALYHLAPGSLLVIPIPLPPYSLCPSGWEAMISPKNSRP